MFDRRLKSPLTFVLDRAVKRMTRVSNGVFLAAAMLVVLIVALLGWQQSVAVKELHHADVKGAIALAQAQDALWRLRYGFPQFLVLGAEDRARIVAQEPQLYDEGKGGG